MDRVLRFVQVRMRAVGSVRRRGGIRYVPSLEIWRASLYSSVYLQSVRYQVSGLGAPIYTKLREALGL